MHRARNDSGWALTGVVSESNEDRRTVERRVTVALFAVALVLYCGVIPGEIVWTVTARAGSGSIEQPVERPPA